MKYEIKMEWIFIFVVLATLVGVYFLGSPSEELKNTLVTAIIGGFTTAMGYLFGKSKPEV